MIPQYRTPLLNIASPKISRQPSKTFKIDWERKRLLSEKIDGVQAVGQAITVITSIEYKDWDIMPDWFGTEMKFIYGMERDFTKANLERLVKEGLSMDDRIKSITEWEMTDTENSVICTCNADTTEGKTEVEVVVNV